MSPIKQLYTRMFASTEYLYYETIDVCVSEYVLLGNNTLPTRCSRIPPGSLFASSTDPGTLCPTREEL